MKFLTIIFTLFLFFACNDSATKSTPTISKAEIKMPTSKETPSNKISIDTSITLDFLMGKFEPKNHNNFLKIENIDDTIDVSQIKTTLNTIDIISAVYTVDTNLIKSKNNLIF